MFFVAIEQYVGPWASDVMYILIITSVLASQIAFHNAINRYTFNLARDGLLPAAAGPHPPPFRFTVDRRAPRRASSPRSSSRLFAIFGADPYRTCC